MGKMGKFGLSLKNRLTAVLGSKKTREETLEDLEETLILADISADLAERIIGRLKKRGRLTFERDDFFPVLKEEIKQILLPSAEDGDPFEYEPRLPGEKNVFMLS